MKNIIFKKSIKTIRLFRINLVSVIVNPFNHFVWLWILQAMNTICSGFRFDKT